MNNKALFIVMGLVISPFLVCFTAPVEAADTDLARQYAPILYFEKEEICYPVDVSHHIEKSMPGNDHTIMNVTGNVIAQYQIDRRINKGQSRFDLFFFWRGVLSSKFGIEI